MMARGGSGGETASPNTAPKPTKQAQAGATAAAGGAAAAAPSGSGGQVAAAGRPATTSVPTLISTAWTAPELLEARDTNAWYVRAAQNNKGDIVVSWLQDDPQGHLWIRRYVDGQWSAELMAATKEMQPGKIFEPVLGIDAMGGGSLIHMRKSDELPLMASPVFTRWSAGGDDLVTSAPTLTGEEAKFGAPVSMAINEETGHGCAVWAGTAVDDGRALSLYVSLFNADSWMPAQLAGTFDVFADYKLNHAVNRAGDSISVVVPGNVIAESTHLETVIVRGDTVSRAQPLTAASQPASAAIVRLDDAGNAMLGMYLSDGTTAEYYVSSLARDSDTWTPLRRLTAGEPRVISLVLPRAGGNPTAFWIENTAGDSAAALYSSVAESGNAWGPPETLAKLSIETTNDILLRSTTNEAGELILFWGHVDRREGTAHRTVYSRRRHPSDGWSDPTLVFEYTGDINVLTNAMAPDGTTVVLWQQEIPSAPNTYNLFWTRSLPEASP
jgi:hypothetical protein